jgi:hypothetical protein
LVEHRSEKPGVDSSILSLGTTILNTKWALYIYRFVEDGHPHDTFALAVLTSTLTTYVQQGVLAPELGQTARVQR